MKMLVVVWILLHVTQHASGVDVYQGEESVVLPCRVSFTFDMDSAAVWSRYDLSNSLVHYRQLSGDNVTNQNPLYSSRTLMNSDALQTGDLSLTLRKPTITDSGTYNCTVSSFGDAKINTALQLLVKEPPPPLWPKVLAGVLVPLLVLAAVAGSIWYRWSKDRAVQQVEVDPWAESVQLPCRTTVLSVCSLDYLVRLRRRAPLLPEDAKVKWTDSEDRKVHVYQNGSDKPEEQHQFYRERTEMKRNLLKTGDLSLTLKYPTDGDRGTYTCTIYNREGNILMKTQVELGVKVCRVESAEREESVQLPFRTTGDLVPEDTTVVWRHESMIVHVCYNGSDQPEEQDQFYRGRTEMKKDLLKTGDLSLTLKHPAYRDGGRYVCEVFYKGVTMRLKTVYLRVRGCWVEVEEGEESVQLPFRTTGDLPDDATVMWRSESMMIVHVCYDGSDQPEKQHEFYRGRTERKKDLLKTGDLSLTLKHPTDRDGWTYVCEVFHKGVTMRHKTVYLRVEEKKNFTAPPPPMVDPPPVMVDPPPVMDQLELMDESTPLKTDQHV